MLAIVLLACAGVALVQAGITLGVRHGVWPEWLVVPRRRARIAVAVALAVVVAVVIAGIAAGVDHRLWQQFKQPNPPVGGNPYSRLLSISGSHRYQYWVAAIHAFESSPWKGIGPGTFEFYWAQHNSLGEFVVNAHSLYVETLAELGIVGLLLVGGLVLFVLAARLAAGVSRDADDPLPDRRRGRRLRRVRRGGLVRLGLADRRDSADRAVAGCRRAREPARRRSDALRAGAWSSRGSRSRSEPCRHSSRS